MLRSENQKTIIFIIVAFIFSFLMRLIWVYQFTGISEFQFNSQFMINTNDGYFWAEGARDIINGIGQNTDNSPTLSSLSNLTAYLFKLLPFSFETIIFYMPAFFSSLLVIPIVLIGRSIGKVEVGFIAALMASISWSYYNRTMVGYYDTDFLNIVFPTILLWSIIGAIETKEDKYLLFAAFDVLLYRWWYPQSYSLEFAFLLLIIVYLIYSIFKHNSKPNKLYENIEVYYPIQLMSLMLIAMVQLDTELRVMLVFAYFMLFRQARWHKHLYLMLVMITILFISTGGLNPILAQLKNYVFKETLEIAGSDIQLHYYSVMQTIKEASLIDFDELSVRISGNSIVFVISFIGYLWMCFLRPVMLLGLPMLGLGILSYSGGLRFTIYAIPILSLGIAYLIVSFSSRLKSKKLQIIFLFISVALILSPNIKHIIEYRVPSVFTNSEVQVLDTINKVASRDDYVISWWDYGYPIRYYGDVKTLSDGGKHSGQVNFPISFSMLSEQKISAKILRLEVEYTEKEFTLDKEITSKYKSNMESFMYDYGYTDSNLFLDSLKDEIQLPLKTRDIYIYLPIKMLEILPTISLFSNIDLMNGKSLVNNFFYSTKNFKDAGSKILLGNNVFIDKRKGVINIQGIETEIKNFVITNYNREIKLEKHIQVLNNKADLNIIYMKDYNQFLVIDNAMYNSMYVQLSILENYNQEFYEPVILTPHTKVFRLKI
jgi:dolichyl-diphosphooligosaccharide--protein glycosyltransferase/undecaprenyl-diphosphooligosaccharide--protein glycosyltransferase